MMLSVDGRGTILKPDHYPNSLVLQVRTDAEVIVDGRPLPHDALTPDGAFKHFIILEEEVVAVEVDDRQVLVCFIEEADSEWICGVTHMPREDGESQLAVSSLPDFDPEVDPFADLPLAPSN
jgi:hypothetical protein